MLLPCILLVFTALLVPTRVSWTFGPQTGSYVFWVPMAMDARGWDELLLGTVFPPGFKHVQAIHGPYWLTQMAVGALTGGVPLWVLLRRPFWRKPAA